MSKTLPLEIIRPIVLYLKNDKESLYSCLLVSRDWCRETVDLLWRQPFHFLYTCNTNTNTNNCNCSKEKRQSQASNLLITYLSIKYNDELVKEGIIKTNNRNVMFNYLEFLKVLDLDELYSAIQDWVQWNKSFTNESLLTFLNSKFNLNNTNLNPAFDLPLKFKYNIFKFFFTNTPKLQLLSFDTELTLHENPCWLLIRKYGRFHYIFEDSIIFVNDLLINESKTPEIKQFFTNLTELVFTTKERKTKLFSYLSQICHNIQRLTVKIMNLTGYYGYYTCGYSSVIERNNAIEEQKELASLIRSQHNLIYFELFDAFGNTTEIFQSLKETQYNSLKILILNNVSISDNNTLLFHLKYLQNLQELRFIKCMYKKDHEKDYYQRDLRLPNLKYLEVDVLDEQQGGSEELSSILLPLVNRI